MVLSAAMLTTAEGEDQAGILKCPKCGSIARTSGIQNVLSAAIASDMRYEARQRRKKTTAILLVAVIVVALVLWFFLGR